MSVECDGVCEICPEKDVCPESPFFDLDSANQECFEQEEFYFGEGSQ